MTPNDDLVSVDQFDELDRRYIKASERAAGRASRTAVQHRRHRFEESVLRRMGAAGESLNVREQLDRPGEPHLLTTSIRTTVDLTERAR